MSQLASHMLAADNHNILNAGTSWLDPESWTTKLGNAGKFIASSVVSGAASFYNTAAAAGKWAGLGTEELDVTRYLTSLDSDLGKYYQENKELTDLTGFVLGSLVPGIAGAKLFNAGQNYLRGAIETGKISGNLARATGLLVTNKAQYLDEAATTIKYSLASQGVMNANTYRALASGVYQNVLESAAGEMLILATMNKSPVLDDLSAWDVTKNVIVGAGIGGAIGGAFDAAKSVGVLRRVLDAADAERLPWMKRPTFASAVAPSNKIITLADDLESTAFPVKGIPPENASAATLADIEGGYKVTFNLFESKIARTQNDIRTEFHRLADKDITLGNLVADISMPVRLADGQIAEGYTQGIYQNLSGASNIARATETTMLEKLAEKARKAGKEPDVSVASRYVKLHGEGAGSVSDELPSVLSLGDLYSKPEILRKIGTQGFSTKNIWEASKLSGERAHLEAELRYLWASSPRYLKEIPDGTMIHGTDIPLLERAFNDGKLNIKILIGEGPSAEIITPASTKELYDFIKDAKIDVANNHLLAHGYKKGNKDVNAIADQAARIANVRRSYLEGTHSANLDDDLFASKAARAEWLKLRSERRLSLSNEEATDLPFLPSYAKIVYALNDDLKQAHEYVADALVYLKQQQQIAVEGNKRVVAKWMGDLFDQLPDYTPRELEKTNRRGAGATLLTGANSGYGTPGQVSTQIGKVTSELLQKQTKEVTDELTPSLVALGNKVEASFEFEAASRFVGRSDKQFVLHQLDDGTYGLLDRKLAQVAAKDAEFDLPSLLDETTWFPLKHAESINAVSAHISASGKRTQMLTEIRAAQGKTNNKFTDVFRPIRPDPKGYPYFAFVYDPRITNSGHVSMIHAASEKELAELIDKVPTHFNVSASPELAGRITVRTKLDVENYAKARQEYEFSRTLHENYIDSELASKGVYSNYFPKSDPQKIVDDILQQHLRETRMAGRELITLRYEPEFAFFEDLGKEYSRYATSKFASRSELIEQTTDNPYFNQIKTALNISNISEHGTWHSFNKLLDSAVSKAWGALTKTAGSVKTEADLVKINELLDKQGLKPAYYDAALQALANHTAPKGVLTEFVRKANSMLSLFTLGLDPLNAVNNAIGSNILRMTELKAITRAIGQGNEALAGDLAVLAKISLPGTGDQILAPTKLVANAISNLVKDGANGPLIQKYKSMGLIKDRVEQLALLIDDFTLTGTESVAQLNQKSSAAFKRFKEVAKDAAEAGEKWTGNKFAEEFNRFVSANVMDQITSLAIKHGVMDEKTAQAYINTFVNRVEGSIIASQRPLIFQGPIGQAIGLFQRYQFNLLQQMFRYVAEGSKKDVAMMMGLQGTIYGLQGLPAFQAINTHIIGQLSGNTEHRDLYTYTYGTVGETAGNFLMYGLASNILQTNIYTRGDINPRHITILPTNLQEIPLVQGWGKFFGSVKETFGKIRAGGDVWESILQGIEHNGISRPLAGMAQVFQASGGDGDVYSTSNRGSILYSNDLLSWASISRAAGGRPLDEARINDAMWRFKVYEASRRESMASLAESVKTTLIKGNEPSDEQISSFAEAYAKRGGKQENFNKWMLNLYKDANVTQAEQLKMNLNSPFSQQIQLLMGGDYAD